MAIPGPNKATLDPNTVILGVNSATLGLTWPLLKQTNQAILDPIESDILRIGKVKAFP